MDQRRRGGVHERFGRGFGRNPKLVTQPLCQCRVVPFCRTSIAGKQEAADQMPTIDLTQRIELDKAPRVSCRGKMFAAGVDSAGPTDWRNYNSIYVERYMTMPADNPEGYEAASVVAAAKNSHGRLLIMHGMMDDNVHVTSALQLMDALQKANLSFESMLYPKGRHGIGGNFQQVQNEFMKRLLQP